MPHGPGGGAIQTSWFRFEEQQQYAASSVFTTLRDGDIGPDRQRQDQNRHRCKARISFQRPQRKAKVLRQGRARAQRNRCAAPPLSPIRHPILLSSAPVSEPPRRLPARIAETPALGDQFVHHAFKMEFELIFDIGSRVGAEQTGIAAPQRIRLHLTPPAPPTVDVLRSGPW